MSDLIDKNFGLDAPQGHEHDLRDWLVNRITHMLAHETDLLMSTLYRLDIDEQKIKMVLAKGSQVPVPQGLADLVLERQRQRHVTKKSYQVDRNTFYWGEEE